MKLAKPAVIGLCSLLLGACANLQEQDRLAQQRAAQAKWSEMVDEYHNAPTASGPRWQVPNQTAENYLARLERFAQRDSDALLQTGTSVECPLDASTRTQLIHRRSPEQLARDRARVSSSVQQRYLSDSVTVVRGDCKQGRLKGRFTAVFTDRFTTRSGHIASETSIQGRIDGHLRNGRLDGEVRVFQKETIANDGRTSVSHYYNLGVYENGEKVGTHVTLTIRRSGGRVLTVIQVLAQGFQRVNTWMNRKPNTRFHMRDGKIEGRLEFASAALKGQSSCTRAGQTLEDDDYCEAIQPKLEALPLREPDPGHARLDQDETQATKSGPASSSARVSAPASASDSPPESTAQAAWSVPPAGPYTALKLPDASAFADADARRTVGELRERLARDLSAVLTPTTARDCRLDDNTRHALVHQLPAVEHRQRRARQHQVGQHYEESTARVLISQGNCADGRLEGQVTAFYRYRQSLTVGAYESRHDVYGRVEAAFVNGRLHGPLERSWYHDKLPGSQAGSQAGVSHARFVDGRRAGPEYHLLVQEDSGATQLAQMETRPDGRERLRFWQNGAAQFTSLMLDGVNDGYIKYHQSNMRGVQPCYRAGTRIEDRGYCDRIGL